MDHVLELAMLDEPSTSTSSSSCPSPSKKRKVQAIDDDSTSRSFWTSLPCEILFKIFSDVDLSNRDLCNVRLVCKSWNSIFQIPEFWRKGNFRFDFTDAPKAMTRCSPKAALFMAKNLGVHWRELKIEIEVVDSHKTLTLKKATITANLKNLFKTVQDFFSALPQGNNLEKFLFRGLDYVDKTVRRLPEHALVSIKRYLLYYRIVCSFIRKQYGLKHLCLSGSGLDIKAGLKLLNASTLSFRNHRRANLLTLEIDNCFSEHEDVSKYGPFINTLSQMRYLTKLVINIEYLSDTSLQVVADNLKDLLTLELACYDTQFYYRASLTSTGWVYLVDQLPLLNVTVQLRKIVLKSSLGKILVAGMPLAHIKLYHATDIYNVEDDGDLPQNVQTNFKSLIIEVLSILSRLFKNTCKSFHAQTEQQNSTEVFTQSEEEDLFRRSQELLKLERISLPVHLSENCQKKIKQKRPGIELLCIGHGYERLDCYGHDIQICLKNEDAHYLLFT